MKTKVLRDSKDVLNILKEARRLTRQYTHSEVFPIHALLALVLSDTRASEVVHSALWERGACMIKLIEKLHDACDTYKRYDVEFDVLLSYDLNQALNYASALALSEGYLDVTSTHLLHGIYFDDGLATDVLEFFGVSKKSIIRAESSFGQHSTLLNKLGFNAT